MRKDGEVSYLLADQLGATTGVLDADGNLTSLRKYWPFGAERDGLRGPAPDGQMVHRPA
ncbi:MAG: hypothetical protein WEC75_04965 [Dehalococcoidia bacterium]